MVLSSGSQGPEYWKKTSIMASDLHQLSAYLFEKEEPLSIEGLARIFVENRLAELVAEEELQKEEAGEIYQPQHSYPIGFKVIFPELDWQTAKVISQRQGDNPALGLFTVSRVEFENGQVRDFATELATHPLNEKNYQVTSVASLDADTILQQNGSAIRSKIRMALETQKELVRIGDTWFPKSLLIDIGKGQLNLAEAILDTQEGGPLGTEELLEQLDIRSSAADQKLLEFSMNYALQVDPRFDEVGPSGKFSWFLRRFEPEYVREVPVYLSSITPAEIPEDLDPDTLKLLSAIDDELTFPSLESEEEEPTGMVSVTLSYPHWRAGSLPITQKTRHVFPTALESENIQIDFQVPQSQERISAWVVRPHRYVIGLREWYLSQNLIPGSIVEITPTKNPGVVKIQPEHKRSNKEWIKTVLVGADGGLVFALLRQSIYAGFSDRMAIAISDVAGIDQIWQDRQSKNSNLKTDVTRMVAELAKLNTQRHVHFVDLYAAVNVIRRTPPQNLLQVLNDNEEFIHVGDHYYHLAEQG